MNVVIKAKYKIMATKDRPGKASPMQKDRQPQQNKTGKETRNASTTGNSMNDLEQRDSSNKGKGPAGENL